VARTLRTLDFAASECRGFEHSLAATRWLLVRLLSASAAFNFAGLLPVG
jgi:membrane-bound metal-dependent hydrolase YbcI (DUF457 family)